MLRLRPAPPISTARVPAPGRESAAGAPFVRSAWAAILGVLGSWMSVAAPGRPAFGQAPELIFTAPAGRASGMVLETSARLNTPAADVLSWSISVALEGLEALRATTVGTDFERLSQGGYAESGFSPDGMMFYSIGVLSFVEPVSLPAGTSEVLRADCRITRKDRGPVRMLPRDGLTIPGDARVFSNQTLRIGGEASSLIATDTSFQVLGCAGLVIRRKGSGEGGPLEIRRETPIDAEVIVSIPSSDHLSPTGFSFGIAHDPAMLRIESAGVDDAIEQSFVKADGFARMEISERGFAVAVLSSASSPRTLIPGDHVVATVSYRFLGNGHEGDLVTTQLASTDELTIQGETVQSVFQPFDALPCEHASVRLDLVVGPDEWVRGDTNGDGRADITDAILTLGHLFVGGDVSCERALEVNLDGRLDISDPIMLLTHLFAGGPAPAPPFPTCGRGESSLSCEHAPCPAL
ncbi:MAG TPA: hypothetical protein VFD71_14445 [Planctomycetota bacterium]|nr:hypothetical protein [Planctomycetota bacterium]